MSKSARTNSPLTLGPAHNLRSGSTLRQDPHLVTMEASINSLTEKIRSLETPDRLETFADGMNAKAWLVQFQIIAHGKGWVTEDKLAATMPMYFAADVGAEWYVHLPQDIKTNYGRLTDAFLEEFRPKPAQRWEAENALRARSQKPGEDLRSFIRVVRREGNRIGLTDDQLVPIVMNNLLPNVRALIPGTPATLTAILDTPVGRGDVQVASTGGIDHSQYQQLFDMLLKQNATISSLEAQVMATNTGSGRQDQQYNNHPQQRQQGYQQQVNSRVM